MEDKLLDVLQKISDNTDKLSSALTVIAIVIFVSLFGFLIYKGINLIYESGKEDGKKGK